MGWVLQAEAGYKKNHINKTEKVVASDINTETKRKHVKECLLQITGLCSMACLLFGSRNLLLLQKKPLLGTRSWKIVAIISPCLFHLYRESNRSTGLRKCVTY